MTRATSRDAFFFDAPKPPDLQAKLRRERSRVHARDAPNLHGKEGGSTVRVRQRAYPNACKAATLLLSIR
jgi:hypothetical protein